jgi:hypothetical protein
LFFAVAELTVTGVGVGVEFGWVAVLDHLAVVDYEDSGEGPCAGDVVGDAEEGGVVPDLSCTVEEAVALASVEAAGGFVEDR